MTTSELILELQKADEFGNLEVVVEGTPIYYISRDPAYYDGHLHKPIQDKNCKFYNVIGWEITCRGEKVRIHTLDLGNALEMDPNLDVRLDNVSKYQLYYYKETVENLREENRKLREEIAEYRKERGLDS